MTTRTWNAAEVSRIFDLMPSTLSLWVRNGYVPGVSQGIRGRPLKFRLEELLRLALLLEFRRHGLQVETAARLVRAIERSAPDLSDLKITVNIEGGARQRRVTVFDAQEYMQTKRAPDAIREALA